MIHRRFFSLCYYSYGIKLGQTTNLFTLFGVVFFFHFIKRTHKCLWSNVMALFSPNNKKKFSDNRQTFTPHEKKKLNKQTNSIFDTKQRNNKSSNKEITPVRSLKKENFNRIQLVIFESKKNFVRRKMRFENGILSGSIGNLWFNWISTISIKNITRVFIIAQNEIEKSRNERSNVFILGFCSDNKTIG